MGCVSFAQLYFPGGVSIKRIFSALAWRQHKNWKRYLAISNSGLERGNGRFRYHKTAHEVLMEMGEKDGIITPERWKNW